jgi:hypothetical protein
MLQGKISDIGVEAIKSHDYRTRIEPKNLMARMLIACDACDTLIELMKTSELNINKLMILQLLETWTIEKPWLRKLILNVENEDISIDVFLDFCLNVYKK